MLGNPGNVCFIHIEVLFYTTFNCTNMNINIMHYCALQICRNWHLLSNSSCYSLLFVSSLKSNDIIIVVVITNICNYFKLVYVGLAQYHYGYRV